MTAGGDAHGVNEQVEALAGVIERQVFVFLRHGQEVSCVVGGDPGLFVLHQVENFIHDVLLHQGLLLLELLGGSLELSVVGGVDVVAQEVFGDAEGVPGVAKHEDFAAVLLIPQ